MNKTKPLPIILILGCVMTAFFLSYARAADQPVSAASSPPQLVRPTPPTRLPNGPGAPIFTVVGAKPNDFGFHAAAGLNPPVDADGNFLIGPDYVPAPELNVVAGVPQGKVQQFSMDSAESKFYPGIARDVFGTVDPKNPKTL